MKSKLITLLLAAGLAAPAMAQEAAPAPAAKAPETAVTVKVTGYGQADFVSNQNPGQTGGFKMRRMRLAAEGDLNPDVGYRVMGEFAGTSAVLQEGWVEYKPSTTLRLKMGQYKVPFSQEAVGSAAKARLAEAPIAVVYLAPYEDQGAMVYGKLGDGWLEYALGAFNDTGKNQDNKKSSEDAVVRLVLSPGGGLSVGFDYVTGKRDDKLFAVSAPTAACLAGACTFTAKGTGPKSFLGTTFAQFREDATGKGNLSRTDINLRWSYESILLMAEALSADRSKVSSAAGGATDVNVNYLGDYVQVSWVMTGEANAYDKTVEPNSPTSTGGWGAWELKARMENFNVDINTTNTGAFVAGTAKTMSGMSYGVNWWLNGRTRMSLDQFTYTYDQVLPVTPATTAKSESGMVLRFQFIY
ncbi:MAG: OprO/OprP family phosphate-selective porin [Deltaproteobacteria bacterium]|nr:OprO/OprP family phosphate-selective porin [Deltaproteobacteria bacterium]